MIKVGIIGYGRYGKKYYENLANIKNFKVIKILRRKKTKSLKFTNNKKEFFKLKNIDLYIIASPTFTHFQYLDQIIRKNKNIIIEKPLVKYFYQYQLLKDKIKKYKKIILINHTDLYMNAYSKLKEEIKYIGKIKTINLYYGKNDLYYLNNISNTTDLPYFEWLPHPLAIIKDLFYKNNFKFKLKQKKIINKFIFKKKIKIIFFNKNIIINLFFSNYYKNPKRNINIVGTKGTLLYRGYNKKKLFLKKKNKKNT